MSRGDDTIPGQLPNVELVNGQDAVNVFLKDKSKSDWIEAKHILEPCGQS